MPVAAAVGGALVSGYIGSKSADKNRRSSNKQNRQTRADLSPYRDAGSNALGAYTSRLGVAAGPQYNTNLPQYNAADYGGFNNFEFDLEGDQGYQFALSEAMNQANRGMESQGGFNSGNRLAALNDRAVGVASQYANDAFNRQMGTSRENYTRGLADYGIRSDRALQDYNIASGQERDLYGREQNYLNRLSNLAGSGQNAAAQTGGFGAQNVQNQIAANNFGANSINNAVQGGISNYLIGNALQQSNAVRPSGWDRSPF